VGIEKSQREMGKIQNIETYKLRIGPKLNAQRRLESKRMQRMDREKHPTAKDSGTARI
jgi:hypothetical protein